MSDILNVTSAVNSMYMYITLEKYNVFGHSITWRFMQTLQSVLLNVHQNKTIVFKLQS